MIQCRHIVKEFQVLLINTNNHIQLYEFVYTQLNDSKYWYVSLTKQLSKRQWSVKWSNNFISNNSI